MALLEDVKMDNVDVLAQLDAAAGDGLGKMDSGVTTNPYLSITQSTSTAVENGDCGAGEWCNSVTHKSYGNTIKVVFLDFMVAWTEKDSAGKTVNRYEPNTIQVEGDLYKGMRNPATGNKVQETWMYLVTLPEHPEDGVLIYTSSPGNMRYLKQLNTLIKNSRLPSGNPAPIYAYTWNLTINPDVSKDGKKYFSLKGGIEKGDVISGKCLGEVVKPTLAQGSTLLIESSPDVDDVEKF